MAHKSFRSTPNNFTVATPHNFTDVVVISAGSAGLSCAYAVAVAEDLVVKGDTVIEVDRNTRGRRNTRRRLWRRSGGAAYGLSPAAFDCGQVRKEIGPSGSLRWLCDNSDGRRSGLAGGFGGGDTGQGRRIWSYRWLTFLSDFFLKKWWEHTFLDVVDHTNPQKQVRVIIELNFRAEFEMGRANEEYNRLVKRLPEIFVGKIERLMSLLKILCGAAKKCMKEKKMHMGPWRKHRYLQAKWLRTCQRFPAPQPFSAGISGRPARPRKSMLTVDLMESLSSLRRPAMAVV
ncbi:hypothetical protein CASFOL_014242 [Castilleja foliolosa]|uniref:Uncharacterized protein n=1 Tax=Castilleja foliolosa TaxID=1961234 RepID=A0ABD3DQ21_9LAMI